jgi:hypothetical protein
MTNSMIRQLKGDWEAVFTVHYYFDGPRIGIASYQGMPHAYICEWDQAADDWSPVYRLSPISPEQLSVVREDWEIWQRYQASFHAGSLQTGDVEPALAEDWPRHKVLRCKVEEALRVDNEAPLLAIPEFRGTIEPQHDFEVRWQSYRS